MKAYKGFDKDLRCRGYQYEVGKSYEEENATLCENGFHACEAPLDVLSYYYPNNSRYCEVELDEVSPERRDDSKVCAKKIKIGAEIGIAGLVKAQFEYVKSHTTTEYTDPKLATAGDSGAATSRGKSSVGKYGIACARGSGAMVKGGIGSVLVCAIENDDDYDIKAWAATTVDGERIKADTWYTVNDDGEFVEVKQDE